MDAPWGMRSLATHQGYRCSFSMDFRRHASRASPWTPLHRQSVFDSSRPTGPVSVFQIPNVDAHSRAGRTMSSSLLYTSVSTISQFSVLQEAVPTSSHAQTASVRDLPLPGSSQAFLPFTTRLFACQ